MAKKKKAPEQPEKALESKVSYGLINDGQIVASIAVDMLTKTIVGTVLDQNDGKTYHIAADIKEA